MTTKEGSTLKTYDSIAESWYRLRHRTRFLNELTYLAGRWKRGRLLNVGCAHGPDFLPFIHQFELWGLDSSEGMISWAVKYASKHQFSAHLIAGDAVSLPFLDRSFDYAVSVAAYHHITGTMQRLSAFRELRRVLRPGGEAYITVWNRWQKAFIWKGSEVMVPWKVKGSAVQRYYHLFTYPEIEGLLKKAGFKIISSFPEHGYRFPLKFFSRNICVLASRD